MARSPQLLIGLLVVAVFAGSAEYSHQSHWEGVCKTGRQQSPIDIRN